MVAELGHGRPLCWLGSSAKGAHRHATRTFRHYRLSTGVCFRADIGTCGYVDHFAGWSLQFHHVSKHFYSGDRWARTTDGERIWAASELDRGRSGDSSSAGGAGRSLWNPLGIHSAGALLPLHHLLCIARLPEGLPNIVTSVPHRSPFCTSTSKRQLYWPRRSFDANFYDQLRY